MDIIKKIHSISKYNKHNFNKVIRFLKKHKFTKYSSLNESGSKVIFLLGWGCRLNGSLTSFYLSSALRKNKIDSKFIVCDGVLGGCNVSADVFKDINGSCINRWSEYCSGCIAQGKRFSKYTNIPVFYMSKWVSNDRLLHLQNIIEKLSVEEIKIYKINDVFLGEIATNETIRYFRGEYGIDDIDNNSGKFVKEILKSFLFSGMVSLESATGWVNEIKPDCVIMTNGVFSPFGPSLFYCINNNIPVILWGKSLYHKDEKIMIRKVTKEDLFYVTAPTKEHWEQIKKCKINEIQREELNYFIAKRISGLRSFAHKGQNEEHNESKLVDKNLIRGMLKIKNNDPIWMISPHLNWDVITTLYDLVRGELIFKDYYNWLNKTLEVAIKKDNVCWIFRSHPSEGIKTKFTTADFIKRVLKKVPSHIKIMDHNSRISSYSLLPIISGCITVEGTIGLEASMYGKPTVVVGVGNYGRRGFTYDPKSEEEYVSILENLEKIPPLSKEQIDLAEIFAYDLFLYRQMALPRRDKSFNFDNPVLLDFSSKIFTDKQFGLTVKHARSKIDWRTLL